MKLFKNLVLSFSLVLLCLTLAGCASPAPVRPLGGGYEEVAHPRQSMKSLADMRVSFQYRAPDGKITSIWPSLYGVNEVINGGVAIFVGEAAYVSSDPEDRKGLKPRLFAVKSPALPLDITDDVLWQWSKANGKGFADAQQRFSLVMPAEKDGRLELQLEFWTEAKDWPDNATLQLGWNQVSEIMREVEEKGAVHKDLRWGTPYILK